MNEASTNSAETPASESAALSKLYDLYLKEWVSGRRSRKQGAPEATERAAAAMLEIRSRQQALSPGDAVGPPQPDTLLQLSQRAAQSRANRNRSHQRPRNG